MFPPYRRCFSSGGFGTFLHLTFTLIVWIGEGVESAVAVVFPVTVWIGD